MASITFPLVAISMCILILGCTPENDGVLSAEDEAAIASTLLSIAEEYNTVWETLDSEQISAFHADEFTYYRRGTVDSASAADFRRAFQDNVATQITAYWADASSVSVDVLNRDAGLVAFLFRGGVETPDGTEHAYSGALTYVFERHSEAWQIVHIHESAYNPEPP